MRRREVIDRRMVEFVDSGAKIVDFADQFPAQSSATGREPVGLIPLDAKRGLSSQRPSDRISAA